MWNPLSGTGICLSNPETAFEKQVKTARRTLPAAGFSFMKFLTSSYFHKFKCLGTACPVNCCFGWSIPLDDEICAVYADLKGLWGFRIRAKVQGNKLKSFRSRWGRCPFHTSRRLCGLQLALGEGYMPRVCRDYPRQFINPGHFAIRLLDTGCPESARLLLTEEDPLRMVFEEDEKDLQRYGNNEDEDYLNALKSTLDGLIALLMEEERTPEGLQRFCRRLFSYADKAHAAVMKGDPLPSPLDTGLKEDIPLFPFSIMVFNELLSTELYEESLSYFSPVLYRVLKYYYRLFDRKTELEGQAVLDEWIQSFLPGHPERAEKYFRLIGHFLELDFFDLYEDYSFHAHLMQAVIHANLVLLLDLLILHREKDLPLDRQTELLAAYTRRAHHNDDVARQLYRCLMDRYG